MSAEQKAQPSQAPDTTKPRRSVEERVEEFFTFWGRCLVDAWRTVFPPREDYR